MGPLSRGAPTALCPDSWAPLLSLDMVMGEGGWQDTRFRHPGTSLYRLWGPCKHVSVEPSYCPVPSFGLVTAPVGCLSHPTHPCHSSFLTGISFERGSLRLKDSRHPFGTWGVGMRHRE